MVHHGGEDCPKDAAWEAQRERNERYDRTFEKIEGHMARQTAAMEIMARQGEQILSLQREQQESRRLIDLLFKRDREQEKVCGDFRAKVAERFHQHEMEPVKEKRIERLRFSTGAWLILIGALLNQFIGWFKGLARVGVGP